jgi:hypothetical protein
VQSTHHDRPSGVADFFQASEHPVCASSTELIAVLKCAPTRSDFFDETKGLEVVAAVLAADAFRPVVRLRDVGAGRASEQEVESSVRIDQVRSVQRSHITIEGNAGEPLKVTRRLPGIPFRRPHCFNAELLRCELPAADPGKQHSRAHECCLAIFARPSVAGALAPLDPRTTRRPD